MKKIFKNNLFAFIIGGIIFGFIGVGATTIYNASQVSYNSDKTESKNVESALNELYQFSDKGVDPILIWTNPTPTLTFGEQKLELDLKEYSAVYIKLGDQYTATLRVDSNDTESIYYNKATIGFTDYHHYMRNITGLDVTGISFSGCTLINGGTKEINRNVNCLNPTYIYGIK